MLILEVVVQTPSAVLDPLPDFVVVDVGDVKPPNYCSSGLWAHPLYVALDHYEPFLFAAHKKMKRFKNLV